MGGFAWVTLATNDSYSLGALVLAHSLRRAGTPHDLVALITPGVTDVMREKLSAVFSLVQEVNILDSKDEANLKLLARPELGITFTKLHCWRLTQYEKCVFVDADALVIRNCDELFEREELSAAPDVGWPDCFNSGVFVFKPSQQTYDSLVAFATAKGSFDGGDQGLLNMYFSDWAQKDISKHLPFIYNMCSTATYSYLPAFKQFGEDVRIIHFIGATKPWLQYLDTLTGIVQPPAGSTHLQPLLQVWWNIFCDNVHPQLNPVMAGLAGALAKLTLGEPRSNEQIAFEEHMRKQSWEQGQIDYLGRDSFDNIWQKISQTLAAAPEREKTPPKKDEPELKKEVTEAPVKAETEKIEAKKPEEVTPAVGTDETAVQQKPSVESSPITTESPTSVPEEKIEPVVEKQKEVVAETETSNLVLGDVQKITTPEEIPKLPESAEKTSLPQTVPETPIVPESVPAVPVLETPVIPAEVQQPPVSELVAEISSVPKEVQPTPVPQTPTTPEKIQPSTVPETPISEGSQSTPEATEALPESQAKAGKIQEKPVPIQVAESVLQAEPKESVSQVALPVGEEAISSIVTTLQESALAVSEALMDPPTSEPTAPKLENGSVDPQTEILSSPTISSPPQFPTSESSTALLPRSPNVVSIIQEPPITPAPEVQHKEEIKQTKEADSKKEPEASMATAEPKKMVESKEAEKTVESKEPEKIVESKEAEKTVESKEPEKIVESKEAEKTAESKKLEKTEESKEVTKTEESKEATKTEKSKEPQETKEPKLQRRQSSSMEKPLLPTSESKLTVHIPQSQPCEISGSVEKSKEEKKSASPSEGSPEKSSEPEALDSPARPTRSKEVKAPPTPTVTEATPPTSPPIDPEKEAEGEPKVAKKVVKKVVKKQSTEESEDAEGESSGKKVTKKVVKKVVKKKEGSEAEGSSSTEKTKKVVKKTTTKTSQLEADKSVPETPPPGSSEVPVPPKRKVKPSTTTKGTTSKKSDTEL